MILVVKIQFLTQKFGQMKFVSLLLKIQVLFFGYCIVFVVVANKIDLIECSSNPDSKITNSNTTDINHF
jgi:hypothetical protein